MSEQTFDRIDSSALAISLHRRHRSAMQMAIEQFARNKAAVAGLVVLVLLVSGSLLAPILSTYDPIQISLSEKLQPPNGDHLLGLTTSGATNLAAFYMVVKYPCTLACSWW